MADANPLLTPSSLPYQLPAFAEIREEHYLPAFETAMAEQRAEIAAITGEQQPPSFENTILALERSGQALHRVSEIFFNASSADSTPGTDAIEEQLAPLLSAHSDAILLDGVLYARVEQVAASSAGLQLDTESRYLLERTRVEFTLAGAGLDEEGKARLRSLNERLATLTTRFEKNLLADTNELAAFFEDEAELDGLSAGQLSAAAAAAREHGHETGSLITLVLPTGHPYLASLTNRGARKRIMRASRQRGIRGGEHDNTALVLEITRLRAERARLLGYATHAAVVTADETAGTPEAVAAMLERLAVPAARNARAQQQDLLRAAGGEVEHIESWDWAFYAERVRAATYDVDVAAMRPYFELERVLRDGVFFASTQLYGVSFVDRPDLVAYHPDARVFEVIDSDGSGLGLYIGDFYTRDSKRGGAWMNALVSQSELLGTPTVVVNNLNIPKPATGEPTLLTLDEATTLFHEFGHALHGLFAHVRYPRFSGTNVFRDFVEFPSQVNEMWLLWPEILANYARHHQTGEPMPQGLVDSLRASAAFNEGFKTSEYLAAAMLDQAWHSVTADDVITDVAAFEAAALAKAGLDNPAVPPRYASTYFAHTFSGGYDAGYYSYIWSEVLDADTVEWFEQNGGLTRANGDRFRSRLLGVGGSKDPLEAYRDFRGRDARIEPLLERRGLE
ncbi:M3 family metallopeptidase [Rathayibacter sp. YIM 133350]|uniref:M3 family metallopeptidase n=1 Tax=Rathayibacter sp. YIM 133350 TaxID=3131992 RepID=UPI00307E73D6